MSLWIQEAHSNCSVETDYVRHIDQTRFYALQNPKHENCHKNKGHCLNYVQAVAEYQKYGIKLARIQNNHTLAIVGRPLEKIADANVCFQTNIQEYLQIYIF